MRSRRLVRDVLVIGLCASFVAGCTGGGSGESETPVDRRAPRSTGPFMVALSQGSALAVAETDVAVVRGDEIDDDGIAAVVRALPRFARDGDRVPFHRPPA